MRIEDKLDKINIYASSSLSTDDYNSLSLLYQPLIGSMTLGFYQSIYALIERNGLRSEEFFFMNILDLLGMNPDEFHECRLKLEAIGLLETFKNDNNYVLLLKLPLTPNQFIVNSAFGVYLRGKLGTKMFDLLIDHFKIEKFDRKGYTNVTKSFDEVFETIDDIRPIEIDGVILGRKPNTPISMKNNKFSYDDFLKSINKGLIGNLSIEGFKKLIINTSYVYGYDEQDMIELFNDSINKASEFDPKLFKKRASEIYSVKTNRLGPCLGEKYINTKEDDSLMNTLANASIIEMLDTLWPNYPASYLKTISDIYESIDLDPKVINILIFNTLNEKNGQLPTLSYFKKAAKTWIERDITDVTTAWNYIRRTKKESVPLVKKYNSNNEKVKTNEWVSNFNENVKEGFETLDE